MTSFRKVSSRLEIFEKFFTSVRAGFTCDICITETLLRNINVMISERIACKSNEMAVVYERYKIVESRFALPTKNIKIQNRISDGNLSFDQSYICIAYF